MNIFIRADSSYDIGSGHIMRCITLAKEFKRRNHSVTFICRDLKGNIIDEIIDQGFILHVLPGIKWNKSEGTIYEKLDAQWKDDAFFTKQILDLSKVDLVLVDHYGLDEKWEKYISDEKYELLVIDDLENRAHFCKYLLDQNFYFDNNIRYKDLVGRDTIKLIGPSYALLREEFIVKRKVLTKSKVENVLVYFGASDIENETEKVIKAFRKIKYKYSLKVDVVLGLSNIHRNSIIQKYRNDAYLTIHGHLKDFSSLMIKADLCIGAGGSTTWERCCIGLPSVVIPVAYNQLRPMRELEKVGAVLLMEKSNNIADYVDELLRVLDMSKNELNRISEIGFSIFDGKGPSRVVKVIESRGNEHEFTGTLQ